MRKFGKKVRNQGGCNTELKTTRTVWRQQAYGKATHSYNANAQLCALGIETAGFVVVRGRVVSRVNESIHLLGDQVFIMPVRAHASNTFLIWWSGRVDVVLGKSCGMCSCAVNRFFREPESIHLIGDQGFATVAHAHTSNALLTR